MVVAFNNLLISLKSHPDASRFARGLGPISLFGRDVHNTIASLFSMKLFCVYMP